MAIGETTLGGAIRGAIEDALWGVGVSMPARVREYDRGSQTAVVEPLVRRPVRDADDEDEVLYEDLPAVYGVKVVWPSGGPSYFHAELNEGDTVLLVASDADYSAWSATGETSSPVDARTHHYSSSFAIPCVRARADTLPSNDVVVAAGGVTASVMLAEVFGVFLAALKAGLGGPSVPLTNVTLLAALNTADGTTPGLPLQFGSAYIKTGDSPTGLGV